MYGGRIQKTAALYVDDRRRFFWSRVKVFIMILLVLIMISNEQIKQCIVECNKAGHTIGLRDISYVLLSKQFEDKSLAYKCVW